ncbi:helix-turn-helix domain-containing protein [Pelagerythrobacter rhizovicinus]|uniref:Helix-turn-helix domain-containing protein n=1 Tax=Pelagerythrobacter rhizovicinus TaxID=2268576 RepID=A0A4V1QVV4_9SPHN|nr:helix-turn-helix domain-containing protein [Pelagerythrobacter rhizovicinus]RXZ63966.1 helix-turn-helix domain-containing protein [Pelagerythrobacter rhizovicinus]
MVDLNDLSIPNDPEEALAAVVALRRLADGIEREAVRTALRHGWSWSNIAQGLGVSKQAAHRRLAGLARDIPEN